MNTTEYKRKQKKNNRKQRGEKKDHLDEVFQGFGGHGARNEQITRILWGGEKRKGENVIADMTSRENESRLYTSVNAVAL